MIGKIAYSEESVFQDFKSIFKLQNARILEIGGALDLKYLKDTNIKEWVSIDPVNNNFISDDGRYISIKGKASELNYSDDYFDFVFSCDAFEHINDLKDTFDELWRVVKKGGILYSNFGPIWSAPDGHHLDIEIKDKKFIFWENNILPLWCHLVLNKSEMFSLLTEKYSEYYSNEICKAIYDSKWINRLSFEDYMEIIYNSNFQICDITTSEEIDYDYFENEYEAINNETIKNKLMDQYKNKNIKCRDILIVLRK